MHAYLTSQENSDSNNLYDIVAISAAIEQVQGVTVVAVDSATLTVLAEIGENGPLIGVLAKPRPWLTDTAWGVPSDTNTLHKIIGNQVPSGGKMRLLYGLNSNAYPNWTQPLATLISLAKRNYVLNVQDASLKNLASVRGDDVVLLYTHGCPTSVWVNPKNRDEWKFPEYSLSTVDDYHHDSIVPVGFQSDYAQRNVVLMNIVWDKIPTWGGLFEDAANCWVYAITPGFVEKYWKINPDGYVSLVACHSGQACASKMRSAIIGAGASVVSGWTEAVDVNFARKSTFFFFDRMMGANSFSTYKCDPPQRPFPRGAVLAAMQEKNLSLDPFKGAQFMFFTSNASNTFGMFTPTIERLKIDDLNDKLKITGNFGNDRENTVVKIQDQQRAIQAFKENEITIELKPEDYGDVQVLVNNHPSNKVQLTQWPLQITWTVTYCGTAHQEMKINAFLRGDVHEARSKPEENPKAQITDLLLSKASTATHRSWGSYTEDDVTVSFNGSGSIATTYDDPYSYGVNGLTVWAQYDPDASGRLAWHLFGFKNDATTATASNRGVETFAISITPIEEFVDVNNVNTDLTNTQSNSVLSE